MQTKTHYTICCQGELISLDKPLVMGILNITDNSFYEGSRNVNIDEALFSVEKMLKDGADIIDIGAISTRPFAEEKSEEDELKTLIPAVKSIKANFPNAILSIDTYRSKVAEIAIVEGAAIINDISAGTFDDNMFSIVAKYGAPYIAMHIKGKPSEMQINPEYKNVVEDVLLFLSERIQKAHKAGIVDIIIDPGFGFGKTLEHNYELLSNLERFSVLNKAILVGISRKSMIQKIINANANDALNGTTVLNTVALLKGADILRVHDVKEAVECVKIIKNLNI